MFVRTGDFLAQPKLQEITAHRHFLLVKFVEKATRIAFHAQAPDPEGAYCLQMEETQQ